MNSPKPNGFFSDLFIYIAEFIVHKLFTYFMIVTYMINKSLNQQL